MTRWTQVWICQACGHSTQRAMKYAKYGGSVMPLTWFEQRSRCASRELRATAKITET